MCTKGGAFFVFIYMRIELPEGILERIMARLKAEQRLLTIKRRLTIFSFGLIGSATAFIPAYKMAQLEISNSGFLQFFSLLFSDFGIVVVYWQSFVLSLLETLPVMSVAALSAVVFVFLCSLRFLTRDIKLVMSN